LNPELKIIFLDLDHKLSEKEEERRQNMKYDSSTGKMYEELGCTNNNGASGTGVDFTNFIRAAFLNESVFRSF
jgi:hypothetical protein